MLFSSRERRLPKSQVRVNSLRGPLFSTFEEPATAGGSGVGEGRVGFLACLVLTMLSSSPAESTRSRGTRPRRIRMILFCCVCLEVCVVKLLTFESRRCFHQKEPAFLQAQWVRQTHGTTISRGGTHLPRVHFSGIETEKEG